MPVHLQDMIDSASADLTFNQKTKLTALVFKFSDIFADDGDDLECFSDVKHQIRTGDAAHI